MSTEKVNCGGLTPDVWGYRFWARIKDYAGMSIVAVAKVIALSDFENWVEGFEEDPESAADAQIAKWRNKYPAVERAIEARRGYPNNHMAFPASNLHVFTSGGQRLASNNSNI